MDRTKGDEGFRAKPYLDTTGHWTVGYGMNLATSSMAEPVAALQLATDLGQLLDGMDYVWPPAARLDGTRRGVLAMMAYNLGWTGLLAFRHMLGALALGQWIEAAKQCLDSLAAHQAPRRYHRFAAMLVAGRPAPDDEAQADAWAEGVLRRIDAI